MKLDKKLKFADKYNWWTEDKNKKEIKLETKLWYIMTKWKPEELFYIFKVFPVKTLKKSYNIIKNDWFSLKEKRKWAIKTLLEYKK